MKIKYNIPFLPMFVLLVWLEIIIDSKLHAASHPFSFSQNKSDINAEKDGLEIDLNRIALTFSQSSLSNQTLYSNYSDANLKGNSQMSLQSFFTLNFNYYSRRFVTFNSIIAEYGFTQINQNNNNYITNKNLDKLLFSIDYTQRMWDFDLGFETFEVGPFLKSSYQTEFYPVASVGRRHIINYVLGAKLFDGKYIKSLYFDIFGEHDLNDNTRFDGFGVELGVSLEYRLNKNVRFVGAINYKKYLYDSIESRIMPDFQFLAEARVEAKLFKSLSISPSLRYYILQAKNINLPASNLLLGVSLNFGKIILPAKKPLKKYEFLN